MRELISFADREQAHRLSAYLVTQSIPSEVEQEEAQWVVWVVNDDDRDNAAQILDQFRQDPDDERYRLARGTARQLEKQEADTQKQIRRPQVYLSTRWSGPWWDSHPGTTVLILISVLVAVLCTDWTKMDLRAGVPRLCTNLHSPILLRLLFLESVVIDPDSWQLLTPFEPTRQGEVWRLVTPIFIHFDVLHILFNMLWMYQLGGTVEFIKGTPRYLVLVLVMAVTSNLAQCYWTLWDGEFPFFGGMSGVVFGLIGFAWMQGTTRPEERLSLPPQLLFFAVLWMILCMGGIFGPIANAAHLIGFMSGVFMGAWHYLWKSAKRMLIS